MRSHLFGRSRPGPTVFLALFVLLLAPALSATPSVGLFADAVMLQAPDDDWGDEDEVESDTDGSDDWSDSADPGAGDAGTGDIGSEGAATAIDHPCAGKVADDQLDYVVLPTECKQYKRVNPFFGFTSPGPKIGVFVAFVLVIFLITIAFFKGRVSSGGSSITAFVVSIALILLVTFVAAFLSFSEYTWSSDWCACLPYPEQGAQLKLNVKKSFNELRLIWWGIGLGLVLVLLIVTKVSVPKPARRED